MSVLCDCWSESGFWSPLPLRTDKNPLSRPMKLRTDPWAGKFAKVVTAILGGCRGTTSILAPRSPQGAPSRPMLPPGFSLRWLPYVDMSVRVCMGVCVHVRVRVNVCVCMCVYACPFRRYIKGRCTMRHWSLYRSHLSPGPRESLLKATDKALAWELIT